MAHGLGQTNLKVPVCFDCTRVHTYSQPVLATKAGMPTLIVSDSQSQRRLRNFGTARGRQKTWKKTQLSHCLLATDSPTKPDHTLDRSTISHCSLIACYVARRGLLDSPRPDGKHPRFR